MLESFLKDIRYSLRILLRLPGFFVVAVLALALGIGANTAIFSVVDAVLIRPLSYPDADRLVMVWEDASHIGYPRNTPAPANYRDWKEQNHVFADMAASRNRPANLTGDGSPELVLGRAATANTFSILGVRPMLGRTYTDDEDRSGARVAVLSYGLWKRRYGGDPALVGRDIVMNGRNTTVAGVMPAGFAFPSSAEFWVPSGFGPKELQNRGGHFLNVVARLKPGVTAGQAQAEMTRIARHLEQQFPRTNAKLGATVVPLKDDLVGNRRTALLVLLAAAGCVLLIACANLANMLLARASGRSREMAVRSAMGAGRWRLVRQLVTESVLLSCAGGLLGVLLARWGLTTMRQMVPPAMGATAAPALNPAVLLFALIISFATGVAFGLAPALRLSKLDLNDVLKQGGRSGIRGRKTILRDALVVSEVALALTLLIGAGLLIRTLARLRAIDPGFRTEKLLTMSTVLPPAKYRDAVTRQGFYDGVLERVRALPGVENAAFSSDLPFTATGDSTSFFIEGAPREDPQDVLLREGTRDYLKMLAAHLVEGRVFDDSDRVNSLPVVVVNETLAKYSWPNSSPIGKRMKVSETSPDKPWFTVIGVVRDLRERGFEEMLKPGVYLLFDQVPALWAVPYELAIRASGDANRLFASVQRAVWAVDPQQPISNVRTMEEIIDEGVAGHREQMILLTTFAALALVLASLGIYGVLSYLVSQRTREVGLRIALGARPGEILRMMVGEGAKLVSIGLAIGLLATYWLSKLMANLLFGVGASDPAIYAAMAAVLGAVALIACVAPAYRAARVDPVVALRDE